MTVFEIAGAGSAAFLAAVWLGYPAAIRMLAGLRGVTRAPETEALPAVSVIVASRDAPESIHARLANLAGSDVTISEIIVARDHRAEKLAAGDLPSHVDGVPIVVVVGDAPGGKATALNAGVRAATGDVLVFADTHQRFEPSTIAALLEGLRDPRIGIVSGALQLPPSAPAVVRRYWTYERALRQNEARVHSTIGVTGAVYAMRRHLWEPLPPALILDDVYTPMRLILDGYRVGFAPEAVARETRAPHPGQEYSRKVRTLTGVMQLCAWLPAILVPVRNPVWLQFLCHKLLRMLTPYAVALIAAWALFALVQLPLPAVSLLVGTTVATIAAIRIVRPGLLLRIRSALVEGLLLQAAVVVAGVNGVRGRWQVWDA